SLTYEVRTGPRTSVVVDGFALSASALRAMARAWTRAVVDDFLAEEAVGIARADLDREGFVLPTVTAAVEQQQPSDKRLRLTVAPGPRASSRRVAVTGNRAERTSQLMTVLSEKTLDQAIWLDAARVHDALTSYYRSEGYLDAAVRVDPIVVTDGVAVR